ncbi:Arm DNA-binding domain-containing protein [uncultured Pseudacidovorax sp.]|uniref:Arm DNA-binding domain-containing protein n=1 Tax=uncultured Pseudacidovorax sp. TaxID=679313 RepID=UPI0025D9D86E|nr:Arm DNA-binding domain-containing protein [uncultured Pseudacidovorax sp.]
MLLTDVARRNAKPTDKPRKLADGDGVYLLVNNSGRYWRWDDRFASERKTLALGVYPEVSLLQARERLQQGRATLDSGIDPMVHRVIAKQSIRRGAANTFRVWPRSG